LFYHSILSHFFCEQDTICFSSKQYDQYDQNKLFEAELDLEKFCNIKDKRVNRDCWENKLETHGSHTFQIWIGENIGKRLRHFHEIDSKSFWKNFLLEHKFLWCYIRSRLNTTQAIKIFQIIVQNNISGSISEEQTKNHKFGPWFKHNKLGKSDSKSDTIYSIYSKG
jgi:hypothetical protein